MARLGRAPDGWFAILHGEILARPDVKLASPQGKAGTLRRRRAGRSVACGAWSRAR